MSSAKSSNQITCLSCPACGQRYPLAAKFCGNDGTSFEGLSPEAIAKECPSCFKQYPAYAQFCPNDAARLNFLPGQNQSPAQSNPTNVSPPVGFAQINEGFAQGDASLGFDGRQTSGPHDQASTNRPHTGGQDVDRTRLHRTGDQVQMEDLEGEMFYIEESLSGKTIAGKYKIESLLGEGGMAKVFKANQLGLDRPVVIKLMHGGLPSMDTALKRFEQESKVTAKIDHPNVVHVFDVGILSGKRPYLVMEYIQGESLRDRLDRDVSLDFKAAATIMIQICSGLEEAHSQGIVHRDLKPENIMLRDKADRPDWVKIVDFGIAHLKQGGQRLTKTGIAIGTVDYMSPEYLSDKPIDHRADIYALGVILFEIIAGRCPFQAETAEAVMAKHLWGVPMPISHFRPDLPAGCMFDQIADRSLKKEPSERYQTALEMRQDIEKALVEVNAL